MTTIWTLVLLPLMVGGAEGLPTVSEPAPKGTLIIDGGGPPSASVKKRALELAGGKKARIVILPQASNLATTAEKAVKRWRDAGAEDVTILGISDAKAAVESILRADVVWMSGGDQERLMNRLQGTGIPEAIRLRYQQGGIVGGASAGAAVMSEVMIARSVDEFPKPLCNYVLMGKGLGLLPGVIVDQHFLKLQRADRLKMAMNENPGLVGIGIDESTAAFVRAGHEIEVVGDSQITIYDPRLKPRPKVPIITVSHGPKASENEATMPRDQAVFQVATLNPGMTFDLDRGMISDPVAESR